MVSKSLTAVDFQSGVVRATYHGSWQDLIQAADKRGERDMVNMQLHRSLSLHQCACRHTIGGVQQLAMQHQRKRQRRARFTIVDGLICTGACTINRPCAQQYEGKYQSCMVRSGRLIVHAPVCDNFVTQAKSSMPLPR